MEIDCGDCTVQSESIIIPLGFAYYACCECMQHR